MPEASRKRDEGALPNPEPKPDFAELRRTMVDCQIRTFGVTDHAVIARFLEVPREIFVPAQLKALAYSDLALRIGAAKPGGEARRLLTPMVLARLMQEAEVNIEDKILDIASGTGYSVAILAGLAKDVTALEADADLQAMMKSNLAAIGLDKITVFSGPLPGGVAERAPFDLIFVNGAVEGRLDHLFEQLREGGRLITLSRAARDPDRWACRAILFEKIAGQTSSRFLFDATAPLLSAFREEPHFVF
jgi:protein-L-isoaspartate(D-aspartate) O-methyltransferase